MFGGSMNAPDFDTPLQMAGGENNAYTSNDYTNFYDVLPAQNIETALWLEADRMANLNLDKESLRIQKKVVEEEFKEVCLNKPYGDSWHHFSKLIYKKHSYKWPTIGKNISHIKKADIEDVSTFHSKYYHPGNAILAISSPLSHETIFKYAEKWFGKINKNDNDIDQSPREPLQRKYREKTVTSNVPTAMFLMAFHMPGRCDKDYYACDIITDILSSGRSSRFYRSLIKGSKLVSDVDCYLTGHLDNGLIIIEGRPMPDVSIQECIDFIWQELDKLKNEEINNRELQKVKNKVVSSIAMSDLSILNKAMSMSYFEYIGMIDKMNEQEEIYEAVTKEEVQLAARKYLNKSNLSVLNYLPKEKMAEEVN
jgi:predicted Zn-dependent peptidase